MAGYSVHLQASRVRGSTKKMFYDALTLSMRLSSSAYFGFVWSSFICKVCRALPDLPIGPAYFPNES